MKQTDDDKLRLAKEMKEWRGFAPTRVAGAILGMSPRTIEHIEQGRGFNAHALLRIAMKAVTCPTREIK